VGFIGPRRPRNCEFATHTPDQTGNNKTAAAKQLGITFRAMRYRLKKLGLE